MTRSRNFVHAALIVFSVLGLSNFPLFAEDQPATTTVDPPEKLGFFAARRAMSEADTALEAKKYQQAADLYRTVARGAKSSKARGRALYGESVAVLLSQTEDRSRALASLETLVDEHPSDKRSRDAAVLLHLATPEPPAVFESPVDVATEAAEQRAVGEALDARIRKLEQQNASLQRQLAEARQELKKKEEAIETLKQLVVGGG